MTKAKERAVVVGAVLLTTLFVAAVMTALVAASTATAGGKTSRTCWQAKATFINYPPKVASFAHWRIVQRGHTYAEGRFSFKGNPGYQRTISRCLTGINPQLTVRIRLEVTLYVACPECDFAVAIRRTR